MALMLSALSHAEYADALFASVPPPDEPIEVVEVLEVVSASPATWGEPPSRQIVDVQYTGPATVRAPVAMAVHLDDVTTATGFADPRLRALALALDAEVPRMGGITIQPRVEVAYRPSNAALPSFIDPRTEVSATGLAVRLYGSKPTRLSGVYPFVEADWWQDNRSKIININGTRIDTDMLRGLFSFNIGAHSNSTTGLRIWFKAKAGSRPSATVGARYRW